MSIEVSRKIAQQSQPFGIFLAYEKTKQNIIANKNHIRLSGFDGGHKRNDRYFTI
ncbi:Uncharacterised protein [Paraprevotella clara]|uniref:Uncharacterized protein n=1 Tax=Paraprevotella clara TaxID=454154 RepID=A0A6N2ZSU3_9BACT